MYSELGGLKSDTKMVLVQSSKIAVMTRCEVIKVHIDTWTQVIQINRKKYMS